MKIFLLSAQNNFYIILSSYAEGYVKNNSSLVFMPSVVFQASRINEECWMLWLDGLWGNRHSKIQKKSACSCCFFFKFLSHHSGFVHCFEVLNLVFSNLIPRGLSTCEMMMMNCFCRMVGRRKTFSIISSQDHCHRSSPSWISDTPQVGFEPAHNLSSGFVGWSCAVMIATTPQY